MIQAEATTPVNTGVVFWSHDKGTAKLIFRLKKDHINQNLSQGTIVPILLEFNSTTASNGRGRHIYHAVIEDVLEGIVSIVLEDNILGYVGRVDGSVYIELPDSRSLDTAGRFTFDIKRSPIDEDVPELEDYYWQGFNEIIQESKRLIDQVESNCKTVLNDLSSKVTSLENQTSDIKSKQAEILKSIEEHDVFTKQESSANVINQIGGAESAILKKELLVDGTEGTAQRYIKDIPNLALGDPLYTEYNVVPGQPNLLNGTSSTLSEVTFIQTQYKETNLVVSNLFKQNDLVTYAVQIDNTAGTADVFAQLAFKKSGNTYVSFNGSSVLKGSIGRSMVQVTVLEEYTNIYVKPLVKSNSTISTTVRYGEEKLIKGSLEAMDEWTPSQADSGLTPINGGMVPFNEKDYEDLLSDDGIVRAETKIVGRGAEIEFKFDVIGTLEKKYPYLFEGLSSMAEKVEKYLSIVKKVEYSELSRGGGSSSSTGNSAYFSKPYIKVTTGSGTFWGLSSFANSSATFSRLGTVLSALSTKQLDDKGRYTTYSVSKKNNFTEPGAISDGVTSAWVEVKDIRLTVELEVNGRTIIEELIAANHVENLATQDEAETGEDNTKTMTPLRVFQSIAQWTKNRFISLTENETVLGIKNFANGLQVGGNNVLTQNGEIRFVTNSTNNSSLESGSIVFKRYGDDVDIYANFQVRASGDLTRDMNIVAESIVDDIFEPGENFSFFVGNETAQAVVKFVGKGIKAHSTLTKGIWYVGTASYKAKNKL